MLLLLQGIQILITLPYLYGKDFRRPIFANATAIPPKNTNRNLLQIHQTTNHIASLASAKRRNVLKTSSGDRDLKSESRGFAVRASQASKAITPKEYVDAPQNTVFPAHAPRHFRTAGSTSLGRLYRRRVRETPSRYATAPRTKGFAAPKRIGR